MSDTTDTPKTYGNTSVMEAENNVPDIQFAGDRNLFKLLGKAWSKSERWMKSTKAMDVPGGVVIQVTTQQGDHVAEALTFVPGLKVVPKGDKGYQLKRSDWSA